MAQLILTPRKKTDSVSEVFIAQPDANKEALAGKLFILVEVKSKKSEGLKIINFIIDNLNHNYYKNERIILREKISTLKVEHIFESTLAKTNKNLTEFLQNERIKLSPKLINITVGVIYENYLYFTNIGTNKALLIYKNKTKDEGSKYKIINVGERAESGEYRKQISLTKIFANVISGKISRGSYFVFTNEALPEYLSDKQLIEIITTLPPASAVEQIKNTLAKINTYVSFFCIIIKSTTSFEPNELAKEIPVSSSQASVDSLTITEETTEKLLTPSGIIQPKKLSSIITKFFPGRETKDLFLKDKILLKRKASPLSFKKIINLLKNASLYFINFITHFLKTARDSKPDKSQGISQAEKIQFKYSPILWFNNLINWFKGLSKRNKALIIIIIICLLLLLQNLFVLDIKNKKVEKEQAHTKLVTLIEQKQNQIDASLLYNNESAAKKFLEEMKELLTQLPQETTEQTAQLTELTREYEQQLEKVRYVIKIDSPVELANLINLNSNAKASSIVLINNTIYAGDSEQKSIYSVNLEDNLVIATADLELSINKLAYPAQAQDNNIYYFNLDSVIKFDTEVEKMGRLTIDLKEQGDIIDMDSYNNKMYLLDRQNNQIYRYNISAESLTNIQPWLEGQADLTDVVSMSIDGYVYLLEKNGELLKYLRGQRQDFELEEVEPGLEQVEKLIVSPELKYIYILEPINQRLVIFDKTGKFLLQYKSDQFTNLVDFTVDETNKKIYFLNNTSIYEVEAKHFE